MKTRITYRPGIPAEVRKAIAPVLRSLLHRVPDWCRDLNVEWSAEDLPRGVALAVQHSYAYRHATLYVCPLWLSADANERALCVRHEISHLVNAPLYEYAQRLLDELIPDEHELKGYMQEQLTDALEASTCDLEHLLAITDG